MKNRRVLLVAESLRPGNGGINRVARLTSRVLAEISASHGFDVQAVSYSDIKPPQLPIPVQVFGGSRLKFVLALQQRAVVYSHVLFDSAAMARAHIVGRYTRQRSACWIHGIDIWMANQASPMVARKRKAALNMDFLIANSDTTIERSGFSHAERCWLSTESNKLPATSANLASKPRVLILSTIDVEYKGHRELLECWPDVVGTVPEAMLSIAGKGPGFENLRRVVEEHPNRDSIELLGFVPEADVDELFASSALFAMPSRGEGFGLVYVEAMRHGLPVIASIHDAGREVNQDGKTGFNVDLDKPGCLSERIIQLLTDSELAERFSRNAQQRWREEFSYSCFRRRLTPIVSDFLGLD